MKMRTLKQLRNYFKESSIYVDDDEYGYFFNVGGEKVLANQGSWYAGYEWEGGEKLSCEIGEATHCCGVLEMGRFYNSEKYPEHWQAIFEFIIKKNKLSYLRTETITDKDFSCKAVEEALEKVGFRLVTTIPSKHGKREGKRYSIKVWEWLKPREKDK